MNHCKTIAIVNQKGGVGKTTSTVNLGVGLAQAGNRVLLVDDDPQHSLTISLGIRNADDDLDTTLATAMQAEIREESVPWEEGIIHSGEGVDLLPANIELSGVEMSLFNAMSREQVLKSVLSRVKENYDYILIDCMPSLGLMSINDLAAADSVIIPTAPDFLSTKGLNLLIRTISRVRRQINPKLKIDGILMTMLVITNDGRKLALDQRLINPMLPDSDTGKVAVCAENVYNIWERTAEKKSTQMVFVDLSTPHNDGQFNVYDDLKKKLLDKGIPESEIAYIHDAKTEAAKKELFGKVRSGEVRVLIGSTQKMGAGTNAQRKLIALHHMDCPWRPSDLQQREGRIIRQGNENPKVDIYTYVTENTFDSYLYQLVEGKQKFIGQIMTSKSPVRSAEDIDETALSYAEIKALCSGNPQIKEKMDLDIEVQKLKLLRSNHMSQRYALEDKLIHSFPMQIASTRQMIDGLRSDMVLLKENTHPNEDGFSPMMIDGRTFTEKKAAGTALLDACNTMTGTGPVPLGSYRGFQMTLCFDSFEKLFKISLQGALTYKVGLGPDVFGNIQRMENLLESMPTRQIESKEKLKNLEIQVENAKQEVAKPFPRESELKEKSARLDQLNILLNMDKRENEIVDGIQDEGEIQPQRESRDWER